MSKIRILHLSDTHGTHLLLKLDLSSIDLVIFSGDESTDKEPYKNKEETLAFIDWYSSLPIPYKIFCAGNHSIAIERKLVTSKYIQEKGIIHLDNTSINVLGLNIFGSPISPTYNEGWAYNRARDKTHKLWATIPNDTDIVITHTPCKGIQDYSYSKENKLEMCGDRALTKRILELKPKLFCCGHIHNCKDIMNAGITQLANCPTIFSNAAVVEDGRFDKGCINNGNIIELTIN